MPDVLIDTTVVENLIGALLVSGPDAVEPDIRVLYPDEPPPAPDADSPGDTVYERWCRMNPLQLLDTVPGKRNADTDNDLQRFVMAITCGVSSAQQKSEPARLNQVAHLVVAALRGQHSEHAATTHHIQIERAQREPQQGGLHPASRTAIVTISGTATRVTGHSATLNT